MENRKSIPLIICAIASVGILLMFEYVKPTFAQTYTAVDTAVTGLSYVQTRPTSTNNYVVGVQQSTDSVLVYSMNEETGALTLTRTIALNSFVETSPTQTADSKTMKCAGTICYIIFDGTVDDILIGVNIDSGDVVGRLRSSGTTYAFEFLAIKSVGQVYVAPDNGSPTTQFPTLVSAPSGNCPTVSTCTITWLNIAQSATALNTPANARGAYGSIGGTQFLVSYSISTNGLMFFNVNNNGFVLTCTRTHGGAGTGDVWYQEGLFWMITSTGGLSAQDDSDGGGATCDAPDISPTIICGGSAGTYILSGSPANDEIYAPCQTNVNVVNSTSGATMATLNHGGTTTAYTAYNFFKDAIVVLTGSNIRIIFISGLDFENSDETNPRDNPDESPLGGGAPACFDINDSPETVQLVCYEDEDGDGFPDLPGGVFGGLNPTRNVTSSAQFLAEQLGLVEEGSDIRFNGVGYMIVAIGLGILIAMFFLASDGDLHKIPTFVWFIGTLAVVGAFTGFGFVDVTFFIIGILVIIVLVSSKILSTLELGGFK